MATRSKSRGRPVNVGGSRKAKRTAQRAKPRKAAKKPTRKLTEAQKRARAKRMEEKKRLAAVEAQEQKERAHLAGARREPPRSPKQMSYAMSVPRAKPAPPGKPIWDIPHAPAGRH